MRQLYHIRCVLRPSLPENDAMAVGVYQALYQAELQVPQDIAVIGYDDIELASFMTPPLTTIHQPKDELGELAIDVLIHRITQPDPSATTITTYSDSDGTRFGLDLRCLLIKLLPSVVFRSMNIAAEATVIMPHRDKRIVEIVRQSLCLPSLHKREGRPHLQQRLN
ncbi:DNA-binding transcriptional repressor RbsR of ribose metabolism [Escherichia coli]|uniref:DNA-binding transcriptional repressor RbsR of ribose metabolism n=1 Tax=Escherichia coli TaxID=562 RepID=A0A377B6U5_ECOLX|nr:DNA-binding transcriptional repressor RbsR of ribose metabolism [Escherichia coli]